MWLYVPPSSGPLSPTILANIAADIQTWGGDVDAAAWGLANSAFLVLNPGALPGTAYSVSAASWTGGTATITIGSHNIHVGQLVTITGVTPTGYNVAQVAVSAIGGTTIQIPIASNPGSYTSGGTVTVGPVLPSEGMVAVDQNSNLHVYRGSAWSGIWNSVTLQNGWAAFGGANAPPGYMIDAAGVVHLRGVISPGTLTSGTLLFTLPTGFQPPYQMVLTIGANNGGSTAAVSMLVIGTAGAADYYYNGSASYVSLDGITFATF